MTQYRKDVSVRVAPLAGYVAELLLLTADRIDAVRPLLPNGEADVGDLERNNDELLRVHDDWRSAVRAQGEAKSSRDDLLASSLETYGRNRILVQHVRRTNPKGGVLETLVQGCPAPSDLAIADVPEALGYLADGIDAHRALLASTNLGEAQSAELRASRDALAQAIAAFSSAERARGEASTVRKKAKEALVAQLRVVESSLLLIPDDTIRASVETICAHHLPRLSRGNGAVDSAIEAEDDADEEAEAAEELSEGGG